MATKGLALETFRRRIRALAAPGPALALLLVCNLAGLRSVTNLPLDHEPDTGPLLRGIAHDLSPHGLLAWFGRDWPLANGFYRPLVVISLAADMTLYGDWARGYRLSSWVYAVVTAVLVYCWVFLLTSSPVLGLVSGLVFSLRQSGVVPSLPPDLASTIVLVALAGLLWVQRREAALGRRPAVLLHGPLSAIPALAVVGCVEWQTNSSVISWVAARTALLGAMFSLACAACCAAFAQRGERVYAFGAFVLALAALASYEQAVMVVAFPVVMLLWARGSPGRRTVLLVLLTVVALAIYVAVRLAVFGPVLSAYQVMQLKSALGGSLRELARYIFPPYLLMTTLLTRASAGPWMLADKIAWESSLLLVAWAFAYWRVLAVSPTWALGFIVLKIALFLPMAFLHCFQHYYYLPEAAAAGLAAVLLWPSAGGATRLMRLKPLPLCPAG